MVCSGKAKWVEKRNLLLPNTDEKVRSYDRAGRSYTCKPLKQPGIEQKNVGKNSCTF